MNGLLGSSAGHRIQVVDCRIGVSGEVGMDAVTNAIYERLTALLMQTDPWELRFESVEEFVREHQRLPRQRGSGTSRFEATLGNWLWVAKQKLEVWTAPYSQVATAAVDISCFDSATGGEVVGWGC